MKITENLYNCIYQSSIFLNLYNLFLYYNLKDENIYLSVLYYQKIYNLKFI